jgi:chemotaxis protein CheY-P-specific phosphatase CheC
MNERVAQTLADETIETLEKLAFIFAESEDDLDQFSDAERITVSADFTGPWPGTLVMEFGVEGLAELSANMLGLDEDETISEEEQRDALKEALNIICGNVLPAIAGSEAVFNISSPQVSEGAYAGDTAAATAVARLTLDEGFIVLYLFSDGDLPD